jgi:hypothetical protein
MHVMHHVRIHGHHVGTFLLHLLIVSVLHAVMIRHFESVMLHMCCRHFSLVLGRHALFTNAAFMMMLFGISMLIVVGLLLPWQSEALLSKNNYFGENVKKNHMRKKVEILYININ